MEKAIRIGGASGFWGDSSMAAPQLLKLGQVDYLVFDYLAELTMSILAAQRMKNAEAGFALDFVAITCKQVLPEAKALGIKIDLPKEKVVAGIEKTGLGFFFAPLYHPAFKAVAEARKMLAAEGQRSIFNMLGPLLNPGRPDYQLVGVFDPKLTHTFGEILIQLGRKGAWVVHGSTGDGRGMDELSSLGVNDICQVKGGQLENTQLDPLQLGFSSANVEDLIGGEAAENAGILEGILAGTIQGPKRDIAVLNAAAGFVITGLRESLEAGKTLAEELLQRGAAHSKLREMQSLC